MAGRPLNTYPQLMIFKGKYDEEIFLVNSAEDVHRLAVAKLRERVASGEIWRDSVEDLEKARTEAVDKLISDSDLPETAPRTAEALKALEGTDQERLAQAYGVDGAVFEAFPKAVKESLTEKFAKFERALPRTLASFARDISEAQRFEKVLKSERAEELTLESRGRSYNLALWILESRGDYEYEDYDFESINTAPSAAELEENRPRS